MCQLERLGKAGKSPARRRQNLITTYSEHFARLGSVKSDVSIVGAFRGVHGNILDFRNPFWLKLLLIENSC